MHVLVVGGAGYIGSHMVKHLLDNNHQVVILDNLSTGYRDAVLGGEFIKGDISNRTLLEKLFDDYNFNGVMQFASFIQVEESVQNPGKYYQNNLANSLNLLDAMLNHDVKNIIFSSSAAIFGNPQKIPIDESHPKAPINPYGQTKWMVEQILTDYDKAYDLKSISLRYFNAAGADPSGKLGERHQPESHLIPLVLQAASGRNKEICIYGQEYNTPDGTCIRDYIHVVDLCQAHLLALEMLLDKSKSAAFNLGNGKGFSVREVIDTVKKITQREIKVVEASERPGDAARLVADARQAQAVLGWIPKYSELETIVKHAWTWEQHMVKQMGL